MGNVKVYKNQSIFNWGGTVNTFVFNKKIDEKTMRALLACEEKKGEFATFSPALNLLVQMVIEAGKGAKAKQILLPYKAALSIDMLPKWDYATFNRMVKTKVSRTSYSNWVNGTQGCVYTDVELDPYVARFKALE